MEKADSYVKSADKQTFMDFAAPRCIDKIEVKTEGESDAQMLPPSYRANEQRARRYLMGAFLRMYLHQPFEPVADDPWIMDEMEYDRWAGSHVFNQIDRMKKQGENLRNKAFDMLEDYNNLRRYFYSEIEQLLSVMNDPCTRIMNMIQMQSTPEYVQAQLEQLKSVVAELDTYKNKSGEEK